MKVYAFLGRKLSGKDTCADLLIQGELSDKKVKRLAFADNIKSTLAIMFNITDTDVFHDQKRKETEKIYGESTARDLMCWYGKQMRDTFGEFFFADIVEHMIGDAVDNGYDAVVITDMRFRSEVEMVVNLPYKLQIFYIDRTYILEPLSDNASESEIAVEKTLKYLQTNDIEYTVISNNGDMDQLKRIYNITYKI
jgi:hypothetical protein